MSYFLWNSKIHFHSTYNKCSTYYERPGVRYYNKIRRHSFTVQDSQLFGINSSNFKGSGQSAQILSFSPDIRETTINCRTTTRV